MFNVVIGIAGALNMIKGFEAGYSTTSNDKMLIQYNNKTYLVKLDELGNEELTNYFKFLK